MKPFPNRCKLERKKMLLLKGSKFFPIRSSPLRRDASLKMYPLTFTYKCNHPHIFRFHFIFGQFHIINVISKMLLVRRKPLPGNYAFLARILNIRSSCYLGLSLFDVYLFRRFHFYNLMYVLLFSHSVLQHWGFIWVSIQLTFFSNLEDII